MGKSGIKRVTTIETDTGEILGQKTEAIQFYLYTNKGFLLFNNKPMLRMFPFIDWINIDHTTMGRMIQLSRYLNTSNALTIDKRPMKVGEIGELLGMSQSWAYVFVRSMAQQGILRKQGNSYYINPLFIFSGKYLDRGLYNLFSDLLAEYVPTWAKERFKDKPSGFRDKS